MKICIVCAPRGVGREVRRCGKVDLHIYLHRSVCWLTHCQTRFLSGCQTNRVTCFLACWLIWLAYPPYWQTDWLTALVEVVFFHSDWSIQLSSHNDRMSQFFFGRRHWLTSGCPPHWLTHPTHLSYWQCLISSLADVTDWQLVVFLSLWSIQPSSVTNRVSHFCGWPHWMNCLSLVDSSNKVVSCLTDVTGWNKKLSLKTR